MHELDLVVGIVAFAGGRVDLAAARSLAPFVIAAFHRNRETLLAAFPPPLLRRSSLSRRSRCTSSFFVWPRSYSPKEVFGDGTSLVSDAAFAD